MCKLTCIGIDRCDVASFEPVADGATKGQIIRDRLAAVLYGNHVVNLMLSQGQTLSEIPQYSQKPVARSRTSWRREESISGIARWRGKSYLGGCSCHAHQVFEIFISFPVLFVRRSHGAGTAPFDEFGDAGCHAGRWAQLQDFFRCGESCQEFEDVGGAIEAGLAAGIEFAETEFEDAGKLLLLGAHLR